jgi:hypothetical protein
MWRGVRDGDEENGNEGEGQPHEYTPILVDLLDLEEFHIALEMRAAMLQRIDLLPLTLLVKKS